jgi:hypothetical protein
MKNDELLAVILAKIFDILDTILRCVQISALGQRCDNSGATDAKVS